MSQIKSTLINLKNQEIEDVLLSIFGETTNIKETRIIFPDGKMLNMMKDKNSNLFKQGVIDGWVQHPNWPTIYYHHYEIMNYIYFLGYTQDEFNHAYYTWVMGEEQYWFSSSHRTDAQIDVLKKNNIRINSIPESMNAVNAIKYINEQLSLFKGEQL